MEKDNLKLLWKEIHFDSAPIDETEIKKCMNMKHSNIISEILSAQKKEMLTHIFVFILCFLIFLYPFVFLKINFSFFTIALFSFIVMFLFFRAVRSIRNFAILSRKTKDMPVGDSIKSFSKMLKKILLIDFLANTVYTYSITVMVIIALSKEKEFLSNSNLFIPAIFIISLLFLQPWLVMWVHYKRYKRSYFDID